MLGREGPHLLLLGGYSLLIPPYLSPLNKERFPQFVHLQY